MSMAQSGPQFLQNVESYELKTKFHRDYVSHRIPFTNDRTRGIRTGVRSEKWRSVRILGEGGFGVVRLQRKIQEQHDKGIIIERAVKEIGLTSTMIDPHREIDAMVALSRDKSNFVQIEGWFQNETTLFIAMEYFELGDLRKCITVPLPEAEAKLIIAQVTEGLQFMHHANIVHRDIKPGNIFVAALGPNWWVKIADFGISKRHSDFTELRTTLATGSEFAAPELMSLVDAQITVWVDMWSVGCLLVWLVAHCSIFPNLAQMNRFAMGMANLPVKRLTDRGLSADAVDFVSATVCLPPAARISAENALNHPWLQTSFVSEDADHSSASSDLSDFGQNLDDQLADVLSPEKVTEVMPASQPSEKIYLTTSTVSAPLTDLTILAASTSEHDEFENLVAEMEQQLAKTDAKEETLEAEYKARKSFANAEKRRREEEEKIAYEANLKQMERQAEYAEDERERMRTLGITPDNEARTTFTALRDGVSDATNPDLEVFDQKERDSKDLGSVLDSSPARVKFPSQIPTSPDQALFDAIGKQQKVRWKGLDMIVDETFIVQNPYLPTNVSLISGIEGDLDKMKRVVDLERNKIMLGTGNEVINKRLASSPKVSEPKENMEPEDITLQKFRQFAASERARIAERKRAQASQDRTAKMNDLVRFSKTFKLKTPPSPDILGLMSQSARERIISEAVKQKPSNEASSMSSPMIHTTEGSSLRAHTELPDRPSILTQEYLPSNTVDGSLHETASSARLSWADVVKQARSEEKSSISHSGTHRTPSMSITRNELNYQDRNLLDTEVGLLSRTQKRNRRKRAKSKLEKSEEQAA